MKRISISLVTLLSIVVVACSSDQASPSPSEAVATAEPTPASDPSTAPSEAASTPAASASGGSSSTSELADLLPDELNGVARTEVQGLDAILQPALIAQGIDASEIDFIFASYGEGADAVIVQAIRIPDLGQPELEALARMMAGGSADVDIETTTVGGKSVLQMTGAGMTGAAYMYFADGAMFTIIGESPGLAAQLLAELP